MTLRHFVMYHEKMAGGGRAWRAIASFDCKPAADAYAKECGHVNGSVEDYRVKSETPFEILDGRNIALDGVRLVYIGIKTTEAGYAIGPAYADTFARSVVECLNGEAGAVDRMRAALREERY